MAEELKEDVLSLTLKEEKTGVDGGLRIKLPPSHQKLGLLPDLSKISLLKLVYFAVGAAIFVGILFAIRGAFTGKVIFEFPDAKSTFIGCTIVLAAAVLSFGVYCWYRVRMAALITDERKLGYTVLKELAEKLPEINSTYIVVNKQMSDSYARLCNSYKMLCDLYGIQSASFGQFLEKLKSSDLSKNS